MLGHRVRRAAQAAAIACSFIFVFAVIAFAQQSDPRQNAPGKFDFYVLALSWSPSYCASVKQRAPDRRPGLQCGGRPFSFVVHGLWPEYERGFPSYCQVPAERLTHTIVSGMLDLMPSPHLIFHEWQRHGTCTGLTPHAYFETLRKARALVKIPADYLDPPSPLTVAPAAVADAFVKANPGLTLAAIAVTCDKTRLTEVRLCMTKDFAFHACAGVAQHGCTRDKVLMPAVRAGATDKRAALDSPIALSRH
jgi:ribonuclease T2